MLWARGERVWIGRQGGKESGEAGSGGRGRGGGDDQWLTL